MSDRENPDYSAKEPVAIMHVMDIPKACHTSFLVSSCMHQHGLPEIVMCNIRINEYSGNLMLAILDQFLETIENSGNNNEVLKRLLLSPTFTKMLIGGITVVGCGDIDKPATISCSIRKLDRNEERLLLVSICEDFLEKDTLDTARVAAIMRNGLSVLEFADSNNLTNGEIGYNPANVSRFNTAVLQ